MSQNEHALKTILILIPLNPSCIGVHDGSHAVWMPGKGIGAISHRELHGDAKERARKRTALKTAGGSKIGRRELRGLSTGDASSRLIVIAWDCRGVEWSKSRGSALRTSPDDVGR